MKLYLSSLNIPDTNAYLSLFAKNQPKRVAIVHTAWNVAPVEKRQPYIASTTAMFDKLGFEHEPLNFEDYQPADLATKLASFSGVWLLGGNTFYLNYWMRESGFDKLIGDLLTRGFVYGGESAGAVVAGKTLHGIELLDNPDEAPEVLWEGLNLVPYGIIPHWSHAKYAGRIEQTYDEMKLFSPVKTLTNSEYIIIQ